MPNGYVLTASADSTIKIWYVENLEWTLIRTYSAHLSAISALEYIDTETMASGAWALTDNINIWSIKTGITNRTISSGLWVECLKMLSNGYYLATGASGHKVVIYNIYTGSLVQTLIGHTNWVVGLELIDLNLLASSSWDSTIRIWNLTSNSTQFILNGHTSVVRVLKLVSPSILASGSDDKTIKLWNITSCTEIRTFTGHNGSIKRPLVLLNDGQTLMTGSFDNIKLWEWNTGQIVGTFKPNISFSSLGV